MADITRLAIEINSDGFLKAKGNAEAYVKAQKEAANESTKYEQELQRLNDILKRTSATGSDFNSSLEKASKTTKGTSSDFASFQLIANKLPGPLSSIASGMMGLVSPGRTPRGCVD